MQTSTILDINTDVYFIPAAKPNGKKRLVFLIAGNPGTIEFYVSFLNELSERLNSADLEANVHYDIYCPGHAYHHLDDGSCSYQSKGLDFQIKHKIAFITNILKSTRFDGEIVLIGHSIGSFIMLDMISKNVLIKKHTRHVSLLMPFIFWDNIPYLHRLKLNSFILTSPTQFLLTWIIQCGRFTIFDIVPRSLLKWFVKGFLFTEAKCDSNYDHTANILCNRLFTHRLVNNFLHMGSDEIRQVPLQQKRMLSILQKLDCDNKHIYHSNTQSINLHIVYTDNDEWAPSGDIELLESTFALNKKFSDTHPAAQPRISYMEGLGHGFTMKKRATSRVVEELVVAVTGVNISKNVEDTLSDSIAPKNNLYGSLFLVCSLIGCVGIGVGYRLFVK